MLLNDNFVGTTLSTAKQKKKESVQLQFVKTNSQIAIIFHFNRIISIKMIFFSAICDFASSSSKSLKKAYITTFK